MLRLVNAAIPVAAASCIGKMLIEELIPMLSQATLFIQNLPVQ